MQGFVKTLIQINSQSGHFPYLLTDAERCCIVLTRNVFTVTMQDDARETVRRMTALASVPLAEERLAALAATLPFAQVIVPALAPSQGRAMTATETATLSISEAADLVRKRKLSPIELTEACLERIAALDARVRAFITVTREDAMAGAQQAAAAIAGGNYKGPLHGIPIALKDLFDTAGVRTTAGSKILRERVPTEDAEATARLKAAGAIILGKLNMHEFAFGATGLNRHYDGTHNPWGLDRMSGGSSSGSAAAPAAGVGPGAP